mgnify:CR=1 FL=1
MSKQDGKFGVEDGQPCWSSPDEPQSHTEHQAALEATVFRSARDPYELVLELDAGRLRVRDAAQDPADE